jgi:HD-GYP domain-containing protein (c-di-GMP phosphodiesterase class II)
MGENRFYKADQFDELISELNQSLKTDYGYVLLLEAPLSEEQENEIEKYDSVICLAVGSTAWGKPPLPRYIRGYVHDANDSQQMLWALETAKKSIELQHEKKQLKLKLDSSRGRANELLEAALQLSDETDINQLYEKILKIMRSMARAEGASLYLLDQKTNELHFSHAQNEKLKLEFKKFSLPVNESSMAGACAFRKHVVLVKDTNAIPKDETFKVNRVLDKESGYVTKSALCFPILSKTDDILGVIQLINSKRPTTFADGDIEVGRALSAHIASALETATLYGDIENLFEGFIKASVTAIEARDPTTSGHSERVAKLTCTLAEKVSDNEQPLFRNYKFSEAQLKELRYASLLHDFGKIGVPEPVLVKQKKLYPEELREIEHRILLLKVAHPTEADKIEALWQSILNANEPKILPEDLKEDLSKYIDKTYDVNGQKIPLITNKEWNILSIKKGSLSENDRRDIESHVTHTFRFLQQIPWTKPLNRVAEIAHAHHEKLNGTGYPRGIKEQQIPFESQIMAVTDIFDALTASDRPYKKAVPVERAIEILGFESKAGQINKELVELFKQQKVFEILGFK